MRYLGIVATHALAILLYCVVLILTTATKGVVPELPWGFWVVYFTIGGTGIFLAFWGGQLVGGGSRNKRDIFLLPIVSALFLALAARILHGATASEVVPYIFVTLASIASFFFAWYAGRELADGSNLS